MGYIPAQVVAEIYSYWPATIRPILYRSLPYPVVGQNLPFVAQMGWKSEILNIAYFVGLGMNCGDFTFAGVGLDKNSQFRGLPLIQS
jgi:hypothetical protein